MEPRYVPAATRALEGESGELLRRRAEDMRSRAREARAAERAARLSMYAAVSSEALSAMGVSDTEAASECSCSCHPSPPRPERHEGEVCSCQLGDDERKARMRSWLDDLQRSSAGLSAVLQAEGAGLSAAAAELGVTLELAGGAAPYQLLGMVDGVRFYLRERHGWWSLQVPAPEAGDDGDPVGFDSAVLVLAEGSEDSLRRSSDPTWPLRMAVSEVRSYLVRRSCSHQDARAFCPDCGSSC